MTPFEIAMRHVDAVYEDLRRHDENLRERLREARRLDKPAEPELRRRQAVIKAVWSNRPDLLLKVVSTLYRQERGPRRCSPSENAKCRTHGCEYGGEMTGGNFGASF